MNVWSTVVQHVGHGETCALVSLVSVNGSVPRGIDAHMVVAQSGFHGTVGGGTLEWKLMAEAQAMLVQPETARIISVVLGPDLGQCCGGRVEASIEIFSPASLPLLQSYAAQEKSGPMRLQRVIANRSVEQVFGELKTPFYIFGAGHVGRALVLALAPLPFDVIWCDPRPHAFPGVVPSNVTLIENEAPETLIASAAVGSCVLVMSHSHALDLAIVDAALRNENIVEVGVIGSQTKRARFTKRLQDAGIATARVEALHCPIGVGGIVSKHPAAIAASVVAQALQWQSLHQQNASAKDATSLLRQVISK
jgi:xanthine dehydrogenase accessory factor